ncbi:VirK protein [Legionella santicrucis]|uniref:VirK protein n=1 Tax=Legionella santicrucis TaxID=45074 RepID=A0A0W0YAN2_9GAMM|nr:VirK family protein [Legionella santicrucis]KTD53619.1 VirK protein [Legionella santicrucis]
MKKLVLWALMVLMASTGFAHSLQHFKDVQKAVLKGKHVHFVVDFLKCAGPTPLKMDPLLVGLVSFHEIAMTQDKLAASSNHFTLNDPQFINQPVYEFARYTLTNDDQMTISMQVLDAKDYSLLTDKVTYKCKLGESVKVYS